MIIIKFIMINIKRYDIILDEETNNDIKIKDKK